MITLYNYYVFEVGVLREPEITKYHSPSLALFTPANLSRCLLVETGENKGCAGVSF